MGEVGFGVAGSGDKGGGENDPISERRERGPLHRGESTERSQKAGLRSPGVPWDPASVGPGVLFYKTRALTPSMSPSVEICGPRSHTIMAR